MKAPDERPLPRTRRFLRGAAAVARTLAALGLSAWAATALALDGPGTAWAIAYALVATGTVLVVHPRRLGLLLCAGGFAVVLAWWLRIEPRNDRAWLPDVDRVASIRVDGDRLVAGGVRAFEYRTETDFVPRWEERTYDLARLTGLDLYVCDWGAPGIVHTFLSWEFDDGRHLAISIETRKEVGESYSALRGFFRQYELYYVVGDERDLVGVRAALRGERVRLHRLAVTPQRARELLLSYAARIDRLREEPAWYNAFTQNCTTSIRLHAVELGIQRPWNWRILVNGRGEELLHMRGMVNTSIPLEELRTRCDVTDAARAAFREPDFERLVRRDLPPRPGRT